MSIDSAEKRRSVAGIGVPALFLGVTPNASQDLEWRQQVGWGYSGLSVANPATVLGENIMVDQTIHYAMEDQTVHYRLEDQDVSYLLVEVKS